MNAIDTVNTVIQIATNPAVQLGVGAVLSLMLMLLGYLIKTQPKAADVAQDVADLEAELEPWVIEAEKTLLRGDVKYSTVLGKARDWLAAQGITGRKGRIVAKYLPLLIEKTVAAQKKA